jgi:5'(3')-deoxyribonucleotidase
VSRPDETNLKVVGCDLDDVLADFIGTFIQMAHDKFGIPADVTLRPDSWSWDNMGWTKEQQDEIWQAVHDTFNFWSRIDVLPGVNPDLVNLLSQRTKMYFPTARAQSVGDDVAVQSARFLLNNFSIPFPTVIVSNEKGPLAGILKYDYFIDDRDKNCLDVKLARPECKVFLVEQPHNAAFDAEKHGIERVDGFNVAAQWILSEV